MKSQAMFNLAMAGRACAPGRKEAESLFQRGRDYTLKEMIEAGLSDRNVMWMLQEAATQRAEAMKIFSTWARMCAAEQGLGRAKTTTPTQCAETIAAAAKAWRKRNPLRTGKGAREWVFLQLVELANAERS